MNPNQTLPDPPPRDPAQWVPRARRRETDFVVGITGPTTRPFQATVRNLSATGMLLTGTNPVTVGDVLTVTMPAQGNVLCLIVRVNAKGAGVRFMQPRSE